MSLDPIRDILTALDTCAVAELGTGWKKAPYLEEIEKNNQLSQNKIYGIRPLDAVEVEGVTKFVTLAQTFELVLVRSKMVLNTGDSELLELSYDNRRDALCVYKKLAYTRAGTSQILNISDLILAEPEFLEEGKVVVQRIQFTVLYRCQI